MKMVWERQTPCDLTKPRSAPYENTWKPLQNTVYWCNWKHAQESLNTNFSLNISYIWEQSKDIQEVLSLIPRCKTMYCCWMTSPSTSTTSGTLTTCTPSSRADWLQEESLNRDEQSVFFTAVNPMYANQDLEENQYDLDKPITTVCKNTWRVHQDTVNWCNLKLAQRKGLQFYQTRSHAFALFISLLAICTKKVIYMKREDRLNPEAWKSRDHQSEQSVQHRETCPSLLGETRRKHLEDSQRGKYRETCRGNADYRIPSIPHSTFQKEDSDRKEIVKRLITRTGTH